jgi:hypothetical protein
MKLILNTLKICSFFLLFTLNSCEDELPNPNNYGVYPMDLKVEPLPNGGYRYSWNKINSSDFISYSIVGSSVDSVPYVLTSDLLPKISAVLKSVTDPSITSIIDTTTLPTGNFHIRLFAFLEGRSLSSVNKKLPSIEGIKEFSIESFDFLYSEKKKTLVLFEPIVPSKIDRFSNPFVENTKIYYVNSETLQLSPMTNNVTLFRDADLSIWDSNTGTDIYVPFGNNFNYEVVNLDTKIKSAIGGSNASIFTFKSPTTNVWWFVTSNFSNINSQTFTFINGVNNFNSVQPLPFTTTNNNNAYFLRLKNDGHNFLAIKPNLDGANTFRVFDYDILNDGILLLRKAVASSLKIGITFSKATPFRFTKDDAYFICDAKGLVFSTKDFTKYKTLAEEVPTGDNINYSDFVLNTEGGKIYALRNGIRDKKNRVVDVFTYPDFKLERSIPYKSTPTKLILNSNYMLLVGTSPNSSQATMIEKVNF